MFCRIAKGDLPAEAKFEQKTELGDECHYNVLGLNKKQTRRLALEYPLNRLQVCSEAYEHRQLQSQDVDEIFRLLPELK